MSAQPQSQAIQPAAISFFERYLTAWVGICIVVGIMLGQGLPSLFKVIGALEIAKVNLPVGLLIWVMIIPMLLKIDFSALHQVKAHVKGIGRITSYNVCYTKLLRIECRHNFIAGQLKPHSKIMTPSLSKSPEDVLLSE